MNKSKNYLKTYKNSRGVDLIFEYIDAIDDTNEYANIFAAFTKINEEGAKYIINSHSINTNSLKNNIYEIKIDQNRFAYCYMKGNYVYILHAFKKKSNKTPKNDLKIAKKRYKEVKMKGL